MEDAPISAGVVGAVAAAVVTALLTKRCRARRSVAPTKVPAYHEVDHAVLAVASQFHSLTPGYVGVEDGAGEAPVSLGRSKVRAGGLGRETSRGAGRPGDRQRRRRVPGRVCRGPLLRRGRCRTGRGTVEERRAPGAGSSRTGGVNAPLRGWRLKPRAGSKSVGRSSRSSPRNCTARGSPTPCTRGPSSRPDSAGDGGPKRVPRRRR